jgi:hypothetical protein
MDKKVLEILEKDFKYNPEKFTDFELALIISTIEATKKVFKIVEGIESFELRKNNFKSSLELPLITYGKDMINDFFLYWVEPSKSGKKMRFELEKCWDLNRRLRTWSKNNKTQNNGRKQTNTEAAINF